MPALQAPVLVAGAGPVGLTAAANLAHFGIPVRIIDSRPAPAKLSKALVIWRRSLLTLDTVLPHEQWLQQGRRLGGMIFADDGAVFAHLDMANEAAVSGRAGAMPGGHIAQQHMIPPGIIITQSQIEAGLEQLLQDKYSISVEHSTQLESFAVDPASGLVHCMLSKAPPEAANSLQQQQQQQREVPASYLLGCDGARSAVRKALGVPFDGFSDPGNRFLMIDATYEHTPGINSHTPQQEAEALPQPSRAMANTSPVGLLLVIPVVDTPNTIRVVWNAGCDGPAQPTVDDFQSVLMQHTRLQIRLKDVLWQSEFTVNERQVDSYVHHGGRVLLAGDAAHVHSPAGGQGMNTGIQDAANLAWKVAVAASGDVASGPQLLQTYQEERHPIGQDAVKLSGTLMRANAIRNPVLRLLRRVALSVLTRVPAVQQRLVPALVQDTVSYTNSSLARPPATAAAAGEPISPAAKCAGTAFPDASIMIDGVMRPATDLLRSSKGPGGCLGSLVLLQGGQTSGRGRSQKASQSLQSSSTDSAAATTHGSNLLPHDVAVAAWPTHWGHWPLHVVSVMHQAAAAGAGADANAPAGAVDAWGLLTAAVGDVEGVLVRPDGIIAAAGGPHDVVAWLDMHGFKHS